MNIERIIRQVLKEENEDKSSRYMFFSNLQQKQNNYRDE